MLKKSYKFWINLLSGPLVCLLVYLIPIPGMDPNGHITVALFAWLIFWWMLKPVPWVITSFVPILFFTATGLLSIKEIASFYGNPIFQLLMGVFLLSIAIEKHGIGERLTLSILTVKWIKGSVIRTMFMFMVVSAILASIISASGLAVLIPIGTATITNLVKKYEEKGIEVSPARLGTTFTLAALYGAEAGCVMTPLGAPHNMISLSLLENTTRITITFTQWMFTGVIIGIILLLLGYWVIKWLFKPGVENLPGEFEEFKNQLKALGPISKSEKMVIIAIVVMAVMLILPSFVSSFKFMDIYWVVTFIGLLLCMLPANESEPLLSIKDVSTKINWEITFMATTGVAMSGLLSKFGAIDYLSTQLAALNGVTTLIVAVLFTIILTNFVSGTAATTAMVTILFPIMGNIGIHPAAVARIIPALGVGMIFPWAGATAATAFSSSFLSIKDMIRGGLIMTAIFVVVCMVGYIFFVPFFGAYKIL
ncbi:sodium-dependent dicarboxylate transporter SdcS [Oxobacter pfennigii]|uniref:Sodium-dependent dicarboxylate transporter SdcS n=1 Tax=Oxobacter pfennigii TaxID=36849 RepID=A0A0N8NSM8_9CLOT|nr:SLC13 family permease [Oxobacter pfennigii]KPU42472.1 sodium-dependent dicarboxylate transporter SdcS [Oxobacter pfennigii]